MTLHRNFSDHWLFVAANYSLQIAQRGALVGQGHTDGPSALLKCAVVRHCLPLSPYKQALSSFAFKFFSFLFSHTSLRTFLGFGPLDGAGSSVSLSSDDMKLMAFGEQNISIALSLSLSDKMAFSKLERHLDKSVKKCARSIFAITTLLL